MQFEVSSWSARCAFYNALSTHSRPYDRRWSIIIPSQKNPAASLRHKVRKKKGASISNQLSAGARGFFDWEEARTVEDKFKSSESRDITIDTLIYVSNGLQLKNIQLSIGQLTIQKTIIFNQFTQKTKNIIRFGYSNIHGNGIYRWR